MATKCRWLLGLAVVVGCFCGMADRAVAEPPDAAERPNIVVIMADDLGYSDIGSYGATRIETPNLDRLADQGMRFTHFYNNAKCSETRASLLSGLYWQQTKNLEQSNHVTLAEVLREEGYHTIHVGKWHVADSPSERGFDRNFGFLNGAVNYFTGIGTGGQTDNWRLNGEPYDVPEADFYATHAFTDYAVRFIEEASGTGNPFFLYLAYNAPHYPLQAPEATVDKYRRRFAAGWDSLRQERHMRQVSLGILPDQWKLTSRNATPAPQYPRVPAWEDVSMERRWSEDLKMAVYAAQIEEMDRGIGRIMARLEELGEKSNTLVVFLSDNGGCPFPKTQTPSVPPGPAESFHNYDTPWANVSNTPFRGYKRQAFEGGIATPFIVHWPAVIGATRRGQVTPQRGHIIDLMPTLVEVSGANYPLQYGGHEVLPMEGKSLIPILRGEERPGHDALFWQYKRHAAVQQDEWKLVALGGQPWELYHMTEDRTEVHDFAQERPEKRDALVQLYRTWADRVGALFPLEKDDLQSR